MTTWLVTGASRGIGREIVEQLLTRGDTVAATLRRPEQLAELGERYPDQLHTYMLDVTDTPQIESVLDKAFTALGRIDVLVSNAGSGIFAVAEDLTDAQIEQSLATNLTGSIQFARRAVPHLRAQGGGTLVQMSSMGGHITFPAFSLYHAAKWGVEGFFQTLATEIAPFGIRTVLVEPGMVRSTFFDSAERVAVSEPYRGGPADLAPVPVETMPGSPSGLAHAIIETAVSADPPLRLLLNSDGYANVIEALEQRLADLRPQRESAAAADAEYPA
ncbi:SDR family oxidoreductase [Pseudonocardia nematodicida]|uniref:SDR family oxidoreductase n=1 Tax=Pseudonocardia nematodicida TaxID=1206997 RepID=A0ABV1KK12_9PSEU